MRKHASSDGTGDKDTINWPVYEKGFLTVTDDGHHFGDYHYLHHDIENGHMVTPIEGVHAAASRIAQNLTGAELRSAQHHLGADYHEAGETPPWEHKPQEVRLDDVAETLLDDAQGAASIQLPRIGAPPPRRIRLFKWGWNDTTKGRLKLTQRGAERAIAAFRLRGVGGAFDKWHSFFDANVKPEDKTTEGNYILSLEGSEASGHGGLFAESCQFTPDTAAEISAGKWPYVSPVPLHTKDGEIVDVKNVSLVGMPATHNAQPLLMSLLSALPVPPKKDLPMSKEMKLCLSTGQHHMAALKKLADSGEPEQREMANGCLSMMGPHLTKLAQACGEDHGKYMKEMADEDEMADKRLALLSTLETEFGTTDPELIEGKVMALNTQHSLSAKREKTELIKLLDGRKDPIPSIKRDQLVKRGSLAVAQTYLSELDASQALDLPRAQTPEKEPPAPTVKNTQATVNGADTAELKLSDLDENQQHALAAIKRVQQMRLGDKFDEAAIVTAFLSDLNGKGK